MNVEKRFHSSMVCKLWTLPETFTCLQQSHLTRHSWGGASEVLPRAEAELRHGQESVPRARTPLLEVDSASQCSGPYQPRDDGLLPCLAPAACFSCCSFIFHNGVNLLSEFLWHFRSEGGCRYQENL